MHCDVHRQRSCLTNNRRFFFGLDAGTVVPEFGLGFGVLQLVLCNWFGKCLGFFFSSSAYAIRFSSNTM